ncbi:unnamed protein product [Phytophthora fragariaefolia]|uniref:Unnamed protein product n=1 Tax=Phytophthora fragariaefolia TaxID=1490495 RepID=A0A9W6WT22_9STRA|nr:unnamed protein product [Phytophthora fragariaefolia]
MQEQPRKLSFEPYIVIRRVTVVDLEDSSLSEVLFKAQHEGQRCREQQRHGADDCQNRVGEKVHDSRVSSKQVKCI